MSRKWELYPARKRSIMMQVIPQAVIYWTWNKKWLDGWLNEGLIDNLEYTEGVQFLKELNK